MYDQIIFEVTKERKIHGKMIISKYDWDKQKEPLIVVFNGLAYPGYPNDVFEVGEFVHIIWIFSISLTNWFVERFDSESRANVSALKSWLQTNEEYILERDYYERYGRQPE